MKDKMLKIYNTIIVNIAYTVSSSNLDDCPPQDGLARPNLSFPR